MTPWYAIVWFHTTLITIGACVVLYGFFLRRIATAVQPLRLQLAERGEKYLRISKDPRERKLITFYLDNALSPWVCFWAFILLPVVLVRQMFRSSNNKLEKENEAEYGRILALFTISVFAANPLFGVLTIIEIVIALLLAIMLSGKFGLLVRATVTLIERIAIKATEHQHHAPAH